MIFFYFENSQSLAAAERAKQRVVWTPDHIPVHVEGTNPTSKELDKFPLYTHFERDVEGELILPEDKHVFLSDELVYAAMKELTQKA